MIPHVHIPFGRLGELAGTVRKHGLAVEVFITAADMDSLAPGWLDAARDALSVSPEISVHAPFMDLSPGAVDARVRAVTIGRFEKAVEMAGALGARCIVFHSGYEKWKYGLKPEIWLRQSLLTWNEILGQTRKAGIRVAVENIFEDSPDNLVMLMKEIGSPDCGICFDTGHFNMFSKSKIGTWLDVLKDHIIELHIHDNDGSADQHRPIGEGSFPFGLLFDAMKGSRGVIYTIEAHNKQDALLALSRLKEYLPGF